MYGLLIELKEKSLLPVRVLAVNNSFSVLSPSATLLKVCVIGYAISKQSKLLRQIATMAKKKEKATARLEELANDPEIKEKMSKLEELENNPIIKAAKARLEELENNPLVKEAKRLRAIITDKDSTLTDGDEQSNSGTPEDADKVLRAFRKQASAQGYSCLTDEIVATIEQYGTDKDKSVLILLGQTDMQKNEKRSIVSSEQVLRLRRELYSSRESLAEFVNVGAAYTTLERYLPDLLKGLRRTYTSTANEAAIQLNCYLWAKKREQLLSAALPLVPEDQRAQLTELVKEQDAELKDNCMSGDTEKIWQDFLELTQDAEGYLEDYKGVLQGTINWVKNRKLTSIIPQELRKEIKNAPRFAHILEIPMEYYRQHLDKMAAEGQTISEQDRQIAVFPSYNDVKSSDEAAMFVFIELTNYYHLYYNEYERTATGR